MKRIEIHLTEEETKVLDQVASADGRSRKNLCETEIRKLIKKSHKNGLGYETRNVQLLRK